MAQRKFSNQDIIKELRSFMKERDEWKADFNKPEIRNVISKLFGLKKSHTFSTPEEFAIALVRSDLNAICCIPSLYWEWVKEEADRLMTLQRVAGTYPHNTDGVHFCLVALEGCELVGWQPLAILLAAGVRMIHGHTGDYDGDCLYLTFLDEKGKELDIDDNWDISDWLISSSSIEGTKALHITCDILKMKIVCGGDMVVTRAFEGCINIAQTGKMAYSLDSLITQKYKAFHK